MPEPSAPYVRPYRPQDREALEEICVRTAHNGGDARPVYADPSILPAIFAVPYVVLEPDLAFVVDDGGEAVGYILGTADTPRFAEWFRARWLPALADRHPRPAGEPATPDEAMLDLMHRPERMVHPGLAPYPAHLHIDLLPPYQGRGYGRRLMRTFLTALAHKGVPAVHLTMATANTSARAFYDRLGFRELPVQDPGPVVHLARTTGEPDSL